MGLRARITLATVATATAAVVLVALVGTLLSSAFLREAALDDLSRQAETAATTVAAFREEALQRARDDDRVEAVVRERTLQAVTRSLARLGIRALAVDVDAPGQVADVLGEDGLGRLRAGDTVRGTARIDGERVAYAAAPGTPAVIAYRPIADLGAAAAAVGRRLLSAGAVGVLVAAVVGWVLGDRLSRPVRRVEGTVARFAGGDLGARVPPAVVDRGDELGELGRGVNAMAEALRSAREEQRGFFRSVAHELRTPLTNIQGYAEGLVDGQFAGAQAREAAQVIQDESVRLTRLVGDVMTLARLDAGDFHIEASTGDVAEVVRGAVAAAGEAARHAGIALVDDAAHAVVETDPDRLRQVVDNLVANALRVTPTGGRIVVRARGDARGGAVLEVEDSGPGLAPEDVPHAFERYALWRRYRSEREVGTGLGLAIVAGLVERLGGRVGVDPGGDGRGATFRVELPPVAPRTIAG